MDESDRADYSSRPSAALWWARIARAAGIAALVTGLAAGLLPLHGAWRIAAITLTVTATVLLAAAAAAILMGMRPRKKRSEVGDQRSDEALRRRHRAAMTVATIAAAAALAMIWLANQRLIEHVRSRNADTQQQEEGTTDAHR